jgi:hypothetical protein
VRSQQWRPTFSMLQANVRVLCHVISQVNFNVVRLQNAHKHLYILLYNQSEMEAQQIRFKVKLK